MKTIKQPKTTKQLLQDIYATGLSDYEISDRLVELGVKMAQSTIWQYRTGGMFKHTASNRHEGIVALHKNIMRRKLKRN